MDVKKMESIIKEHVEGSRKLLAVSEILNKYLGENNFQYISVRDLPITLPIKENEVVQKIHATGIYHFKLNDGYYYIPTFQLTPIKNESYVVPFGEKEKELFEQMVFEWEKEWEEKQLKLNQIKKVLSKES